MFLKNSLLGYQPNLIGSLVLVSIWAVTIVFFQNLVDALLKNSDHEPNYQFGLITGTIVFMAGYYHVTGIGITRVLYPSTVEQPVRFWRLAAPVTVVTVALYLVETPLLYPRFFFGADSVDQITNSPSTVPLTATLLALLSKGVIGPITEELLFRGIILRGLLQRNNPWLAIVLSAVLFGALHIGPSSALNATLAGFLYGWLYWRSRSVLPCSLAHCASNIFNWAFYYFPYSMSTNSYFVLAVVAGVISIAGIYYIHQITRTEQ